MNETTLTPYLRDIREYPLLSHEDEVGLIKQYRQGSKIAAEKLVTSNLRFVISIAKRYQYLGMPLSDLISEGNIGLLNAIGQFDETRGVKFSSYASWLIKRQIFQALADKSKMVRMPIKRVLALLKQYRKLNQLSSDLRNHDVANETLKHLDQKIDKVKRKLNTSHPYLSLDAPLLKNDETNSFIDFISEDEDKRPDKLVSHKLDRDIAFRAIEQLREREKTILKLYYGLGDAQKSHTLKEIGEQFGITRERVRQIKEQAINKLRDSLHVRN